MHVFNSVLFTFLFSGLLWTRGALAELCASISAAQIVSSNLPTSPWSRERRDGGWIRLHILCPRLCMWLRESGLQFMEVLGWNDDHCKREHPRCTEHSVFHTRFLTPYTSLSRIVVCKMSLFCSLVLESVAGMMWTCLDSIEDAVIPVFSTRDFWPASVFFRLHDRIISTLFWQRFQ
jgi:hypothetical protein